MSDIRKRCRDLMQVTGEIFSRYAAINLADSRRTA